MIDDIVLRRALPSDTPAMLQITRDVWSGTDYIPRVWRRWLSDADGFPFAAMQNGRLVGLQHADRQPDGTCWLEGIRVAADVTGRGVGRLLVQAGLRWAREAGCPRCRLSTSSENPASNALARGAGFRVVGEYRSLVGPASPRDGAVPRVTLATAADGDDVWRAVCATFGNARRGDADHRDTGGQVYTEGWTAYTLTRGRLQSLLAAQSVALHEEGSGVAIVTSSVDHPSVRLGLLTGHESATEDLVAWTAAQAASMGFSTVRATLPASGAALPALRAAGFEENISFSMLLHEIEMD